MVLGYQKQWQFLKGSIERGRIPHALIFAGQEGLGKKTLAIEFIKLLNCQFLSDGQPCQTCQSCKEIEKNIYPDLALVEPEEKEIRVAQIRKLRSRLSLRSFGDCFKAVILDRADCLNQEAQSAFLKLLEEPEGKTLFILIVEHPEALFSTILSRVEILKFYPLPHNEIKEELKKRGLSENQSQEIAFFSWGRIGRAMNFLRDPKDFENEKQRLKEIIQLTNIETFDLSCSFQYAKEISSRPQEIKNVLDLWLRYFREKLLGKISEQQAGSEQENYSLTKLRKILEKIQNTQFLLSNTNVNPRLALETLMLELG